VTKEMSKKKRKTFGSSSLQLEVLKNEVKAGIKVSRSKIILDPTRRDVRASTYPFTQISSPGLSLRAVTTI
jgi:hypothetical protein